jgi:hypothetical protein
MTYLLSDFFQYKFKNGFVALSVWSLNYLFIAISGSLLSIGQLKLMSLFIILHYLCFWYFSMRMFLIDSQFLDSVLNSIIYHAVLLLPLINSVLMLLFMVEVIDLLTCFTTIGVLGVVNHLILLIKIIMVRSQIIQMIKKSEDGSLITVATTILGYIVIDVNSMITINLVSNETYLSITIIHTYMLYFCFFILISNKIISVLVNKVVPNQSSHNSK